MFPVGEPRRRINNDGELAEVSDVRQRFRVGEAVGGEEREGEQVRRQDLGVSREGWKRDRRFGGGFGAPDHGGFGVGCRVHDVRYMTVVTRVWILVIDRGDVMRRSQWFERL